MPSMKVVNSEISGCLKVVLFSMDVVLLPAVVTPLLLAFWWSTWSFMDYIVLPGSAWICFGLGTAGHIVLYLVQFKLQSFADESCHPFLQSVWLRLFTYIFAVLNVTHWRGVWYIWDELLGTNAWTYILSTCVGACVIMLFRSFKNIRAPPILLATEIDSNIYLSSTRFMQTGGWRFIGDAVLTVVVIHAMVISFWRGVWGMLDHFLFPQSPATSAFACLLIGYISTCICYIVQYPLHILWKYNQKQGHSFFNIPLDNILTMLTAVAAIFTWRGLWNSYAIYVLPGHELFRYIASHVTSFISMAILGVSNCIAVRGCNIDGGLEPDDRILLSLTYTRKFVPYLNNLGTNDMVGNASLVVDTIITSM